MQVLETPREKTSEKIFSILFTEDELTWQTIIYDMIDSHEIDPWNVDIGLLSKKFIEKVRLLKEMDFRISGKVILAAAILLKIKSNKLVDEDIAFLDSIINGTEEEMDLLEGGEESRLQFGDRPKIFPRTPQPRKRKVSIYDLVRALEQALEVEQRRKRWIVEAPQVMLPKKSKDISEVISDVYGKIITHFKNDSNQSLTFSQLIPSDAKEDKVMTFIPLLHLETQRKVDMDQQQHFGEIFISLAKKPEVKKAA